MALFAFQQLYIADNKMTGINGYNHSDIEKSLANIDGKLDQALGDLGAKVEILSHSIDHLTLGLADFKELFKSAVPIKLVIIMMAIIAAIFGVTEGLKAVVTGIIR